MNNEEKWREEFEDFYKDVDSAPNFKTNKYGDYSCIYAQENWSTYLAASKKAQEEIGNVEHLLCNAELLNGIYQEEIQKLKERIKNLGFNNDYVEEVEDKNWNLGQQLQKLQERINLLERPDIGIDIIRGYINRIESLEYQIAKGDELINWIIQQSQVKGYPTAMEWNALVNQVKKVVR